MAAGSASRALGEMAISFMQLAREEAAHGYDAGDMRHVRDAAEKAWLAVLQATDAAMGRHGVIPEPGPRAHQTRHEFLEKVGRDDMSARLHEMADRLHARYFYYGGVPSRERMNAALDEAADYIRRVWEEV
jgi:hypothetical protein